MAFDEQDVPRGTAELGLKNYWGYTYNHETYFYHEHLNDKQYPYPAL
jgi:hypothetical protein